MAREVNLGENTGKSLSDIAALMESRRAKAVDEDADDAELVDVHQPLDDPQLGEDDDDLEDDTTEDDDSIEDGEEDDETPDDEDEGETVEEDDTEEDDDQGVELEIDEDTLIELEGEENPVSLKALKDVYQADKTVVERVKATEAAYLEATQARSKALDDGKKANEALTAVVRAIDGIIAQPLVPKPNDAMKSQDPSRYWAQYEAYQNDQQRIVQSRQAVLTALSEHGNKVKENLENYKLREMAVLAQKLPALRDEKKREQATRDILAAASAYGFTPEEVDAAGDHRIYQMAYDAQQYRKLKNAGKEEKEERTTKIKQKISQQPKVLRSKGTSAKSRNTVVQQRIKALKVRASKSGRPEDVAAFMSVKRQAN